MPLFSVHLTFSLEVLAPDAPEPLKELAIHIVSAPDEDAARARGASIGRARETTYLNGDGETVRDRFHRVVEVQHLSDGALADGMEVAWWLWREGRLIVEEGWDPDPAASPTTQPVGGGPAP